MSLVLTSAPRDGSAPQVPTHPRGSGYRFEWCMWFNGFDSIAYADSTAELMEALIPGYVDMHTNTQLTERISFATMQCIWTQAQTWADSTEALTDTEREMLAAPRIGELAPTGTWAASTPLVVLTVAYSPYTSIPAPVPSTPATDPMNDAVWFIDPTSEDALLRTLHEVGVLRVMRADADADVLR